MKLIFWISAFFVFYPYAGYPLILWINGLFSSRRKKVLIRESTPFVSVVVAVKNEEKNIQNRINNLLLQSYPKNRFEIVVASDGSTDSTNEIVSRMAREIRSQFNDPKIIFTSYHPSRGKSVAINEGVKNANGEILVFTDARQRFQVDAIKNLTSILNDPTIGCVSGELLFEDEAEGKDKTEIGLYWRYEKWIRKQESLSGSIVGATGAIYSIRKALFEPMPANTVLDDVLIPMIIVQKGFSAVFCDEAKAYDRLSSRIIDEWRRKVRTLSGNWQLLSINSNFILPWRNPLWFRFVSHKVLRLIVPFLLPIVLLSCASVQDPFYKALTFTQLFIYSLALLSYIVPAVRNVRFVNLCYFFILMNAAAVVGFYHWLMGNTAKIWR
ncbi:MAG: glycosyltransferase family 2 protein [Baekduia sp.]